MFAKMYKVIDLTLFIFINILVYRLYIFFKVIVTYEILFLHLLNYSLVKHKDFLTYYYYFFIFEHSDSLTHLLGKHRMAYK